MGEYPGFPRAGSGEHQHRTAVVGDRLGLGRVEAGGEIGGIAERHGRDSDRRSPQGNRATVARGETAVTVEKNPGNGPGTDCVPTRKETHDQHKNNQD